MAAQATSARLNPGKDEMTSIIPIIPFRTESCTIREVAYNVTTMSNKAPMRSDHTARLKKSHHSATARPPTNPPIIAIPMVSGRKAGRAYLITHWSVTMAKPGHRRNFGCFVEPILDLVSISVVTLAVVIRFRRVLQKARWFLHILNA